MPHSAIVIAEPTWIAARVLDAWLKSGNRVAEVWCFKDNHRFLQPPRSVAGAFFPGWDTVRLIRRHGLKVRVCPPLRKWPDAAAAADAAGADCLLTLMSLQIIPESLLAHFGDRAINVHPALLPDYKGPTPRKAMVMDGKADEAGGVTFHVLTPGIDEGPIVAQLPVPFSAAREYYDWEAMIAEAAGTIAGGPLIDYLDGKIAARPQEPGSGSYLKLPDTVLVDARLPAERIALACKAFGSRGKLRWQVGEASGEVSHAVTRLDAVLGPPTGAGPKITRRHLESDCADARIRLRRASALTRPARWIVKARAMMGARRRRASGSQQLARA